MHAYMVFGSHVVISSMVWCLNHIDHDVVAIIGFDMGSYTLYALGKKGMAAVEFSFLYDTTPFKDLYAYKVL